MRLSQLLTYSSLRSFWTYYFSWSYFNPLKSSPSSARPPWRSRMIYFLKVHETLYLQLPNCFTYCYHKIRSSDVLQKKFLLAHNGNSNCSWKSIQTQIWDRAQDSISASTSIIVAWNWWKNYPWARIRKILRFAVYPFQR